MLHEIPAVIDRLALAFEESTTPFVAGSDTRVLDTAGVFVNLMAVYAVMANAILKERDPFGVGEQGRVQSLTPLLFPQFSEASVRFCDQRPGSFGRCHGLVASDRRSERLGCRAGTVNSFSSRGPAERRL